MNINMWSEMIENFRVNNDVVFDMHFFLHSEKGKYSRINSNVMLKMLILALEFGWEPKGTTAPQFIGDESFIQEDSFNVYSGSFIPHEDALNIAKSLEAASQLVSDDRENEPEYAVLEDQDGLLHEVVLVEDFLEELELPPVEFFSGRYKADLLSFIDFCKLGGFSIF